MAAKVVLTAYGRPSDRTKLDILAEKLGMSKSEVMVFALRELASKHGVTGTE